MWRPGLAMMFQPKWNTKVFFGWLGGQKCEEKNKKTSGGNKSLKEAWMKFGHPLQNNEDMIFLSLCNASSTPLHSLQHHHK